MRSNALADAILKCAASLVPVESRKFTLDDLWIKTKKRQVIPFSLNPVQLDYLNDIGYDPSKPLQGLRELILKARQFGFTTLIEALFFLDTVNTPNTITVIIANDKELAVKVLRMVTLFYDRLPEPKPHTKTASVEQLYWPSINSRFYVETAGKATAGRGDTINNLHATEYAFWQVEETVTGLLQAIPEEGNVFIESTANGRGNQFHIEYQLATGQLQKDDEGRTESVFNPHFYPWYKHPDYSRALPEGFEKTYEEHEIANKFHLTDEQLFWRRRKRLEPGMGNWFPQEYPSDDQEAFKVTGHLFFPDFRSEGDDSHVVPALYLPTEKDENGKDRRPPRWFKFGAGMDPGYGDPWAFSLGCVDENGRLHALESDEEAGLTADEQAERVVQMLRRWGIPPNKCSILAGSDLWIDTHKGVKLIPASRSFEKRGLVIIPLANDGISQYHRNTEVRNKLRIEDAIRIYAGFNSRLTECLSNAKAQTITVTTPDSRREAVVHDKWSHSVFAFGGLVAHWIGYKAAKEPDAPFEPMEQPRPLPGQGAPGKDYLHPNVKAVLL